MRTLRDQLLARRKAMKCQAVPMPELGEGSDGQPVVVHVRALSAAERDDYEAAQLDAREKGGERAALRNFRARLVALCACDGQGNRLFADGDEGPLGELPADEVGRLFEAAARLNGLTVEAQGAIAKNS